MSDGGQVEKVCAGLGETWEILRMDMKPYPCCRSAHGGIDGALQLRQCLLTGREQGRDAEAQAVLERTESLTAATYKIGYQQCAVSAGCLHPKTPGEAKFSLPYALAHSLLYCRVDGSSFTPEAVQDPRLQALLPRITVTEDPELTAAYPDHWSCRTTLRLKNGQEVTAGWRTLPVPTAGPFRPRLPWTRQKACWPTSIPTGPGPWPKACWTWPRPSSCPEFSVILLFYTKPTTNNKPQKTANRRRTVRCFVLVLGWGSRAAQNVWMTDSGPSAREWYRSGDMAVASSMVKPSCPRDRKTAGWK